MKTKLNLAASVVLLLLSTLNSQFSTCLAQGTAFTYQGRLNDGANPASGSYDLRFAIYDAVTNGGSQGVTLTNAATGVSNGLFTVTLDFGNQFTGADRWLEIAVRTNGGGAFDTLTPRQKVTATPYAIQAVCAATASSVAAANLTGTLLNSTLPSSPIFSGTVNAGSFSGSGAGVTSLNADNLASGTVPLARLSGLTSSQLNATTWQLATNVNGGNAALATNVVAGINLTNAFITNSSFAGNGGGLTNLNTANLTGSIAAANFGASSITASKIASGQVVKSLNGLTDAVVLQAGTNVTLSTSGGVLKISADEPTAAWFLTGNSNTVAGFSFIGSKDNRPLEFRVNNFRALRLQSGGFGLDVPSVVGGTSNNFIGGYIAGAVIGGGNYNTNDSDYSVISGGLNNEVRSSIASVTHATIGGGDHNIVRGNYSVLGGGKDNYIDEFSQYSVIAGGYENSLGYFAGGNVIGGGGRNSIGQDASSAFIGGGFLNTNRANYTVLGGGYYNLVQANANYAHIGGGSGSEILSGAEYAAINGGRDNQIGTNSSYAVVGGGRLNTVQTNSDYAVIGGGQENLIEQNAGLSFIGGGYQNVIGHDYGGVSSIFEKNYNVIGGGYQNILHSNVNYGFIGGGQNNSIDSDSSVVAGGYTNTVESAYAVVGGGRNNSILMNVQNLGHYSVIGGGISNMVDGRYAVIPGGSQNTASGDYSFAAGRQALASHDGSFVWADATGGSFASTGTNEFDVRASGGVNFDNDTSLYFGSNIRQMLNLYGTAYGIGVQGSTLYQRSNARFAWYVGGTHNNNLTNSGGGTTLMMLSSAGLTVNGTFVSSSDRNVKENFSPVNSRDVLARVVTLPLTQWNYKTDADTRHLGPMAQDFYAAFGIGPDDKHITMVDADGVALAAIQGLNQKLEEKNSQITELEKRLEKLEQLLNTKTQGTK